MSDIKLEDYEELGTCDHCGEDCIVHKESKRCDNCDGQFIHCGICDEEQHEDYSCRHVFQDRNFEWQGSGVMGGDDADIKASFLLLVKRMPQGFAEALAAAIAQGKFYSFLSAPLIGSGGHMELHGLPWERGFGKAMVELGEGDDAEELTDGYSWLASIYLDKTPDANTLTLEWLKDAA